MNAPMGEWNPYPYGEKPRHLPGWNETPKRNWTPKTKKDWDFHSEPLTTYPRPSRDQPTPEEIGKILSDLFRRKEELDKREKPFSMEGGNKVYRLNGEYHRVDGPAIIHPDGGEEWYFDGHRHRTDGPAVSLPGKFKQWWMNGVLHRDEGPAVEAEDGYKAWYCHGKLLWEEDPEEATTS